MIMRFFQHLARDPRGVAAVEMAIVLPVLSIMALASVDFVFGFTHKIELQQYAQAGADFVVASGDTALTAAEVKAEVVALSGLPTGAVTVVKVVECNAVKITGTGLCPGLSPIRAEYFQITVTDSYTPILNIDGIADFVGQRSLTGSSAVRLPS